MEWHKITGPMLKKYVAAGNAVAVLPVGSTEKHGEHLPIGTDTLNVFAYSGIFWGNWPYISYSVNSIGAPVGATKAIKDAFETWDSQVGHLAGEIFNDNVAIASRNAAGNKFDGKNVVSWGKLGKGIVAQTTVWYKTQTKIIVEFGIVFSTAYKWGIDADGEGTTYSLTKAFDVQNIATHEVGHTLMLDDLYFKGANALTMYGYVSYGQTYAISLGAGDIRGVKILYP